MTDMTVELRQSKLQKNSEDMERWLGKMLRAARKIEELRARRKRLLRGPGPRGYTEMPLTGIGGGAVDGLDDSLGGL
jgi:hypothetical protein